VNPERTRGIIDRLHRRLRAIRTSRAARKHSGLDKRLVLSLSDRRLPSLKQLKHLPRFLTPQERLIAKLLVALIAVSLLAVLVRFVGQHVVEIPTAGGEYREATVGGPHFINPILTASNDVDLDIVKLVFSGLMRTDSTGQLVPDLAESYELSADGLVYTFAIRPGIEWHDGTALTSGDIAATISYIKDPAWKSPLIAHFRDVTVETPDLYTVVFYLQEPFAPFLSLLTVGVLPEHLWQDIKPENATRAELNVKPIGTGPFRFRNFTKDKKGAIRSYTLERHERYYGHPPYLDSVTFHFYTDFAEAVETFTSRKVDGLSFLPLEFRDDVGEMRTAMTYTLRLPQYTAIFLNQKHNDLLRNRNVRKALALAIDKEEILRETLGDNGVPAHGPILPGFVGFHPDIKKYRYDPAAATDLLEEAGWEVGEDGLRRQDLRDDKEKEKDDEPQLTLLQVTLVTVDTQENIRVAQIIKRKWEGVGVKTELDITPASKIQSDRIRPRDYDALLYGEILGPDPDPYPFWHSSQGENGGLNLSSFSNRRTDEVLEQARSTNDDEERTRLYREFQDILAEEVPAIFLYSPTYTYVVSRKVMGIGATTVFAPADRFTDVTDWYIETKRAWR